MIAHSLLRPSLILMAVHVRPSFPAAVFPQFQAFFNYYSYILFQFSLITDANLAAPISFTLVDCARFFSSSYSVYSMVGFWARWATAEYPTIPLSHKIFFGGGAIPRWFPPPPIFFSVHLEFFRVRNEPTNCYAAPTNYYRMHQHKRTGRVSFGRLKSLARFVFIACTEIKWFYPNITWFVARKLLFENSRGAAAPRQPHGSYAYVHQNIRRVCCQNMIFFFFFLSFSSFF